MQPSPSLPVVIAHRGASGYRPEHTLASYRLAIEQGADFVEPDLVSTRDGVLVARHENEISGTTDIAERKSFAHRRTTKLVGGALVTGWFTEDLSLAELKSLRAIERLPWLRPANTLYDGELEVPTFEEILDLVALEERSRGIAIGVYPETKHPSYFAGIGLPLEPPLVDTLRRHGLDRPGAPVLVQSFEAASLRRLRSMTRAPLVQLVGDATAMAPFAEVAGHADAVGLHKDLVTSAVVAAAHGAGLLVHAWTLRDENAFLPHDLRRGADPAGRGAAEREYAKLLDDGVDGIFTDFPDTAVRALDRWAAERLPRSALPAGRPGPHRSRGRVVAGAT